LIDSQFRIKIADFGLAGEIGNRRTYVGTPGQYAPELEALEEDEKYSGALVDVYNSGVILFAILFRKMPFGRAII
jgi:serine/threonine protein kinase